MEKLKPAKDSAFMDCEKYIEENHLEYIADEIRKAYRKGWDFGVKKQPAVHARLAKENERWNKNQTEAA